MKCSVRLRRRNKRARAVRRLQGVVNAQDVTIRALHARVQGLGGKVVQVDNERELVLTSAAQASMALGAELAGMVARVRRLERVPRFVRALFGAK